MTQRVIQGDQLDLTLADGSVLTAVDADLLEGSNKAFYRNASNLNAGTLANARVAVGNVTQHQASINHDALSGFVSNEHINHGSVSISGGTSLSGGGTIAANRTITLLNDSPSPGNNKVYGTSGAGVKGWQSLPAGTATVTSSPLLAYSGASSTTSWSHLQATMPLMVQINFICAIAQGGFGVGSVISLNNMASQSDGGSGYFTDGIGVQLSTSSVIVRISNRTVPYVSTTYGTVVLTAANWGMLIRIIT